MPEAHVVTGATGFFGSSLLLHLLLHTDEPVWCLVRARDDAHARERIDHVLAPVAEAYGVTAGLRASRPDERCHPLPGDLHAPGLRSLAASIPRDAMLWHCAATLRHSHEFAEEIRQTNVESVRRVVSLCEEAGAQLNYVSTAYVGGPREGEHYETLPDTGGPVRNLYERSKVDAEHLVSGSGVPWRIIRPSIISGPRARNSVPFTTPTARLTEKLKRFRYQYGRKHQEALADGLTVPADPDTELNLVPVDLAVSAAARIGTHGAHRSIFHLTNRQGTAIGMAYAEAFGRAGLPAPRFTDQDGNLRPLDRKLADTMEFDLQYATGHQTFDRHNTDSVIGRTALDIPLTGPELV